MEFTFWGTEYRKNYFTKWYDHYTGIDLAGRNFLGIWLRDNRVVIRLKKPIKTKRVILLYIYLINWIFVFDCKNFKLINGIYREKHYNGDVLYWYEGYTGLKILGVKFLGFSISDRIYDDLKYFTIFIYIFGFTFSINNKKY